MPERIEITFRRICDEDSVEVHSSIVADLDGFNQSRTRDWFNNLFNDVASKVGGDYGFKNVDVRRKP